MELGVRICVCPNCNGVYSITDWDQNTLNVCNSRSVRRQYKSLSNAIINNKYLNRIYVCPECNRFVKAVDIVRASNRRSY